MVSAVKFYNFTVDWTTQDCKSLLNNFHCDYNNGVSAVFCFPLCFHHNSRFVSVKWQYKLPVSLSLKHA